jgi:hypothetical protein
MQDSDRESKFELIFILQPFDWLAACHLDLLQVILFIAVQLLLGIWQLALVKVFP